MEGPKTIIKAGKPYVWAKRLVANLRKSNVQGKWPDMWPESKI